jgi:putative mycofactocin binding protein MftB
VTAVVHATGFDSRGRYRLSPRVGLRPEPFGALAYHFDTRRLVFLKAPELVELVHALADHPSADAAIDAVIDPSPGRRPAYVTALASLCESGVVELAVEPSS